MIHCGRALPEGIAAFLCRRAGGPEMAERIDDVLQHEKERQLMGARGYELKKRTLSFEKFFRN
jgi:hypothetical protein